MFLFAITRLTILFGVFISRIFFVTCFIIMHFPSDFPFQLPDAPNILSQLMPLILLDFVALLSQILQLNLISVPRRYIAYLPRECLVLLSFEMQISGRH